MNLLIFKITAENKIFGIDPNTFEIRKIVVTQETADAYRKMMHDEIMPRINIDCCSHQIIGHLTIATPLSPNR